MCCHSPTNNVNSKPQGQKKKILSKVKKKKGLTSRDEELYIFLNHAWQISFQGQAHSANTSLGAEIEPKDWFDPDTLSSLPLIH